MNNHQKNINRFLEIRIGFWKEFFICLALALAARGSMIFQLNLSVDDYAGLNFIDGPNFVFALQEMRFFAYCTNITLHWLGSYYPYAGVLWPILFNAAFVFAGLVAMRIWTPLAGSLALITGASLFALFPYHSDYLSFQMAGPAVGSMLVIGWASLYFCVRGGKAMAWGLAGLVYAVSGQITFVFLFFVVLFEALIWAFQSIRNGDRKLLASARPWLVRLGLLFLSAILYVFINKSVLLVLGIPVGSRVVLSGLEEYPAKMLLVAKQCYFFLFKGEISIPLTAKFLQLGLFGLVAFAGVQAVSENPSSRARVVVLWGLCLLASVGAIAASMGAVLPIAGEYGHMNPRSLSGLAMYWAGVYAMAWAVCSRDARRCVAGIGVVLVFIYAVNVNRQAIDHARINERDRLVASRMVERLSQLPEFEKMRTVVLCPTHYRFNLDRITTETSGFNISSLYRELSSTAVLREVSSWPFEAPTENDRQLAKKIAQGRPVWPLAGSVFIEGDIGVVVLPQMENQAFKN
ncbi:MAG: hypothetical protein NTZ94_01150 [Verrucomicrobia bacterium]|nr:hypothetical protein [Verrucomicrobiota bacterium]